MAVLQFWGFPACKTGDFHFAILGIFSLQETVRQKLLPVDIALENIFLFVAFGGYMVKGTGIFDPQRPCHTHTSMIKAL
jgi:hypothetical protein